MTLEDLGNLGDLLGGIGVVVTLAYLGLQIRHNTQISRLSAYYGVIGPLTAALRLLAEDPDLTRAFRMLISEDAESLDSDERSRAEIVRMELIVGIENLFYLHHRGWIDDEQWENVYLSNKTYLTSPALLSYIETRPGPLSKRLATFLREQAGEHDSASPLSPAA